MSSDTRPEPFYAKHSQGLIDGPEQTSLAVQHRSNDAAAPLELSARTGARRTARKRSLGMRRRSKVLHFILLHALVELGLVGVPWEYDREMYKRRNEVERLFRRLKGYRRIFSRFEKLDSMFLGFLSFVLVADGLRGLC